VKFYPTNERRSQNLATEWVNHRKSYILMDQIGIGELTEIHEEAQRLLRWNGSML